jgi:uracil-DNA glycosylase family 4
VKAPEPTRTPGEPFVGRAGQLLTEIITKGMRLRREDVYIANVIRRRPPGNRNPEPDEVAPCEPFLVRQLELIRPEVVWRSASSPRRRCCARRRRSRSCAGAGSTIAASG